jgi:hypothetical protein
VDRLHRIGRNERPAASISNDEEAVMTSNRLRLGATVISFVIVATIAFTYYVRQQQIVAKDALCRSRLSRLWLAMQNYRADHGHFPQLHTSDASGRPLHSWRVLLAPYLECREWYVKYKLNEPWDSDHNLALARSAPKALIESFSCPNVDNGSLATNYVALHYEGDQNVTCASPCSNNRPVVIEYPTSDVFWTEPRDISLDQIGPILANKNLLGAMNFVTCCGRVGSLYDNKLTFNNSDTELVKDMMR